MEVEEACESCGSWTFSYDYQLFVTVCESCGYVRQEIELRHAEFGTEGGKLGTLVSGAGTVANVGARPRLSSDISRIESRRNHTFTRLENIASILRLPRDKVEDVRHLISVVTQERWGTGHWIDILIGTCIYIVARQSHLPLPAAEIASALTCDVSSILKMYHQVRDTMNLDNLEIDQSACFDRAVYQCSSFTLLGRDVMQKICWQGHCILDIATEWSLSTGRHPSAIVAAAIVLVGRANNVKVDLEEISDKLHIHTDTTKSRLKEFIDYLVRFGQGKPWGKDITPKTLSRHLPMLLQYLQLTMKLKCGKPPKKDAKCSMTREMTSTEGTASHLANFLFAKYGEQIRQLTHAQHFVLRDNEGHGKDNEVLGVGTETRSPPKRDSGSPEGTGIPLKRRKIDNVVSSYGSAEGMDIHSLQVRKIGDERAETCDTDSISGDDGNKEGELLEQPWKWKPLPPAFLANRTANARRAAKIEAAKSRITAAKQDFVKEVLRGKELIDGKSDTESDRTLDSEDLLIQYCLIRGGDEELLKAGYYKLVLSTPPVQPETEICSDKDMLEYFNLPSHVELLQSLSEEDPL